MKEFLTVNAGGVIEGTIFLDTPEDGPFIPCNPFPEESGITLVEYEGFSRKGRSDSEVPYWQDESVIWIDEASVEVLRGKKNEEINAMREATNTSFLFRGKEIRCRTLDRSDIDGTNGYVALFGVFPDGWLGAWKAADNSYVTISTVEDWKEFYKAMVDTGSANFRHAQQLKAALAIADTKEEVEAIKWGMGDV